MYLTTIHDVCGMPRAWGKAPTREASAAEAERQWDLRVGRAKKEGTLDASEQRGETRTIELPNDDGEASAKLQRARRANAAANAVQKARTSAEYRHAANLCDAVANDSPPLARASWEAQASAARVTADRLDQRGGT